jgi:hypothetical protein
MSDDVLKEYKTITGFEDLTMEIIDGKMVISPSDAGIFLLTMTQLHNKEVENYQENLVLMLNKYEALENRLSNVLDFLANLHLEVEGELKNRIEKILYPLMVEDGKGNVFDPNIKEESNDSTNK